MKSWHPLLPALSVGHPVPARRSHLDSGWDLGALLEQADEQGVAYAVTRALSEGPWRSMLTRTESDGVRVVQEAVVRRDMIWEQTASSALTALPGGVRPILLKGAGARTLLYDHPGDRTCVDLDLMLPKGREALSRASLESAGWEDEVGRRSSSWHVHGMSIRTPLATMSMEIHRTLDNAERGRIDYEALAPCCREMQIMGRPSLVPDPAAQLLVGATHALRHGMDVPLKSLVDVHRAVTLCSREQLFVPLLDRSPGAAATLGVMLRLCHALFGTDVPPVWRRDLAAPVLSAPLLFLSLDHRVPGYARAPFNRSRYLRRLWFQSLLTGSPAVMARVGWAWAGRRLGR
ncbi:MAG: nucleotidyltransferase family protein [Pseudomonadota bacterium]